MVVVVGVAVSVGEATTLIVVDCVALPQLLATVTEMLFVPAVLNTMPVGLLMLDVAGVPFWKVQL